MYSKRHLLDMEQRHPEAGSSWPSWPRASWWRDSAWLSILILSTLNRDPKPAGYKGDAVPAVVPSGALQPGARHLTETLLRPLGKKGLPYAG